MTRKKITFYDCASPAAYSDSSLSTTDNKIGGAEASVIRVAMGLARSHDVVVIQRRRSRSDTIHSANVKWVSVDDAGADLAASDVVIVIRRIADVLKVRRFNRKAKLFVWYHDWYFPPDPHLRLAQRVRRRLDADLRVALHLLTRTVGIAVSDVHVANIRSRLDEAIVLSAFVRKIGIERIYNPVAGIEAPVDPVGYIETKLVYFSAPWKGLDLVLDAFEAVRLQMPDMQLYVATPGYDPLDDRTVRTNVVPLGNLTHGDLLRHVGTSLCVFYPAFRIPETFGLVFAESHGVGTPVIAHRFGAATELLSPDELVDATDIESVVERVRKWRGGARPTVVANPSMKTEAVVERWAVVLTAAG